MEDVIVLDTREQAFRDKIAVLASEFLKGGYYTRLVMTDDIISVKDVHGRAKENKDEFFYGIALPAEMQETVDNFVRVDKKVVLGLIEKGEEHLKLVGLEAEFDKTQKAYLVKISSCGMGFYISKQVHTPRHQRQKRITLSKLSEKLNSTEHTNGRRKIVLGQDAVV